ncbi:MAG: RDD family protein, partial [Tepidiformaceae bacterium]
MSHFDLVRTHRTATLDQARTRPFFPGFRARVLAFAIDIGVFIFTAPFLLGFCAVVLRDYWAAGAVAIVAGYIAGSWALCSKTAGMAYVGIQLVDERTGRCPGLGQVLLRTALTVPPLVGATVVLNEILIPGRAVGDVTLALAVAAALMGAISAAWGVLDSGRMLHDRL